MPVAAFISKARLEAFSDGIMAIIVTIMAFNTLPESFSGDLSALLAALGVFFASFAIVSFQWMKHAALFRACKEVTGGLLWFNSLYLFFLSLLPFFTKWVITQPRKTAPAIGYDLVFFVLSLCYHGMQRTLFQNERSAHMHHNRRDRTFLIVFCAGAIGIFLLSFYCPAVSIVFFIGWPVISSAFHLLKDDEILLKRREIRHVEH